MSTGNDERDTVTEPTQTAVITQKEDSWNSLRSSLPVASLGDLSPSAQVPGRPITSFTNCASLRLPTSRTGYIPSVPGHWLTATNQGPHGPDRISSTTGAVPHWGAAPVVAFSLRSSPGFETGCKHGGGLVRLPK